MNFEPAARRAATSTSHESSAVTEISHRQSALPGVPRVASPPVSPSSAFERWSLARVLAACGNPPIRLVLWDGESIGSADRSPVGSLVIRNRATLWRLLRDPRIAFGDAYSDGSIDIEGPLVDVLAAICEAVGYNSSPPGFFSGIINRTRARARRSHSPAASRESVYHHYDIGNDFYRLWLDERMQYTCAYYARPAFTLEQAQLAKLDHVCRKLQLKPGDTVVEAGCGWGGLALHMAAKYGVSVRAINLSREQIAYARDWAKSAGLSARIEFIEDDYRNVAGHCDAFVSVGMLEHVGEENLAELGRVVDRVLAPNGRGLIHSIGRNAPGILDPWIDKRIFPGAYPPSLVEILRIFEPTGFSVLDVENLRLHYARTLEHWLERFEASAAKVAAMFDQRFVRMWRLYLAGSIATFNIGSLQLFQVVFTRERNNQIPWTREHLYSAFDLPAGLPGASGGE